MGTINELVTRFIWDSNSGDRGIDLTHRSLITLNNAASALTVEVKDLTVESIKLAANFEESTNSLAIFAGGTYNARRELNALDNVALNTPGLKLEGAETGYKRLRALNFETKVSLDLIRGLGIARTQSGADQGAVDRVITNLTQLTSGSGTAADVRQTIQALPSLRGTFQRAFGTADFGDINKLAKANPDEFIRKFTAELSKAKTAQVGLNIAIEQGSNSLTLAGRKLGEPFLQPLTRDVLGLTKTLNENENTIKKWGQNFADTYNGLSTLITENPAVIKFLTFQGRNALAASTFGLSETIVPIIDGVRKIGEERRKAEEKLNPQGAEGGLSFNFQQAEEETEKAKKAITRRQELIDLQKQVDASQIENNLSYSKAVAASRLKGIALIEENTKLEIEALQRQIQVNKNVAISSSANLSEEDFKAGKGLNLIKQRDLENAKLENQIVVTRINSQKQVADDLKASKETIRDLNVRLNQENQFAAYFAEAESAVKKLKETINDPALLRDALKLQQAINAKQFNALSYESGKKALSFDQDAMRVSRIRDNQFASFKRALDLVERKVDFAVKINQLNRDISETDFYSKNFNPNNPKSFEEISRRFIGDKAEIRNSLSDISALRRLDLGPTGIAGESAVAGEVLKVLPPLQELVSALNNPKLSGDARYLLNQRSDAFKAVRANEQQKLNDFLYDQETAGLNRKFAYDQLALLKNQSGLSRGEYANNFLDITKNLGNDLDPYLRRGQYEQNLIAAKEERQKQNEAQQYWKSTAEAVGDIKTFLTKLITANGLKIDGANLPAAQVFVDAKDFDITEENNPGRASETDVAEMFGNIQEGFANSFGGYKR